MTDRSSLLINELQLDPRSFRDKGKHSLLLEEFFNGAPIGRLGELLSSREPDIQSVGVFVASELGEQSSPLAIQTLPLAKSKSTFVRFHALEVIAIAVNAGQRNDEFALALMESLDDESPAIRTLTMTLLTNSTRETLTHVLDVANRGKGNQMEAHVMGLSLLLAPPPRNPDGILNLIESDSIVLRRYGAVAWGRPQTVHGRGHPVRDYQFIKPPSEDEDQAG